MVEIYTFASAANHFSGGPFARIEHFVNTLDFVSRIGKCLVCLTGLCDCDLANRPQALYISPRTMMVSRRALTARSLWSGAASPDVCSSASEPRVISFSRTSECSHARVTIRPRHRSLASPFARVAIRSRLQLGSRLVHTRRPRREGQQQAKGLRARSRCGLRGEERGFGHWLVASGRYMRLPILLSFDKLYAPPLL
jgi:hypothetical protein